MIVIDPGHVYKLNSLDGPMSSGGKLDILQFVKREGKGYPGNIGHYPGTTTQEVLRVLIDRIKYVDNQIPDSRNRNVLINLREAIYHLELRAAARHGRELIRIDRPIEEMPVCSKCGHIGCDGSCHA